MMNETREGRTEPQELARGDATRGSAVSRVQQDQPHKNRIREPGCGNGENDAASEPAKHSAKAVGCCGSGRNNAASERNRIPEPVLGVRFRDWFRSQRAFMRAHCSPEDGSGVKRIRGAAYSPKMQTRKESGKPPSARVSLRHTSSPAPLKESRRQPSARVGMLVAIVFGVQIALSPGAAHAGGFWENAGEKMIDAKDAVVEMFRCAIFRCNKESESAYPEMKGYLRDGVEAAWISTLSSMSQKEWLRWTERMTRSAPTRFDKALDMEYLRTHIGGGNHRLFDGGHTLKGALNAVNKVCETGPCAPGEKLFGYVNSLWKDMSTPKGLPFVTLEKAQYDTFANWLTKTIPGASRNWVSDLLSYNTIEIFSSALSIVAVVYMLNAEEYELLWQTLAANGIISLISANPIMAIMTVAMTAYVLKTGRPFDKSEALKGAAGAGIAMALFGLMSAPFMVEMAVVMTVMALFHTQINADKIGQLRQYMVKTWKVISVKANEMQARLEGAVR